MKLTKASKQQQLKQLTPTDPWTQIKNQTDEYEQKMSDLLNKAKSATKALFESLESVYQEVHNPKEGEEGKVQMDEFDHTIFEKNVKTVLDVFIFQELTNVFGIEKSTKARMIEAYIARHPNLRSLVPRPIQQRLATQPQLNALPMPRQPLQRKKAKLWTGPKKDEP